MNFHTKYNTRFSLPLRRWNAFVSHPQINHIRSTWSHLLSAISTHRVYTFRLKSCFRLKCICLWIARTTWHHVQFYYRNTWTDVSCAALIHFESHFHFPCWFIPFFWLASAKYREISLNEMRCNWHFYGFLICSLHNGKEWKSAS